MKTKKKEDLPLILQGKVCPYCESNTAYVDSEVVYGKSYGMIYFCKDCVAYVGVHKGTDVALGRLADKELREAKKQAHFWFDQIARTELIHSIWRVGSLKMYSRSKAYLWLSYQMNIHPDLCHIGYFDIDDCERCINVCKPIVEKANIEKKIAFEKEKKEKEEGNLILDELKNKGWYK